MDRLIWFWFITSSKSYQAIHCGNCSGRLLLIRRSNELIIVSYSTAFDHSVPFGSVHFSSVQFAWQLNYNWRWKDDLLPRCSEYYGVKMATGNPTQSPLYPWMRNFRFEFRSQFLAAIVTNSLTPSESFIVYYHMQTLWNHFFMNINEFVSGNSSLTLHLTCLHSNSHHFRFTHYCHSQFRVH